MRSAERFSPARHSKPAEHFTGTLVADDPADLATLQALGPVRVGGRRTTHGLAHVTIRDAAQPPAAQLRGDGMLVIRLRSPGIFADRYGRPIPEPDPGELADVLQTSAKVVRSWTRWQQVGGWHAASGLPKPAGLAAAAGSTYLIQPERSVATAVLSALARRGLGLRRHEGFGDLAPAPVLAEGKLAREQRKRHASRLTDSVAALRGVPVRWPGRWPELRAGLLGHAAGDDGATALLRREAQHPLDADVGAALMKFLGFSPPDAAYVAGELAKL